MWTTGKRSVWKSARGALIVLAPAGGGGDHDLLPFGHVYVSPDRVSGLLDEARDVVTHGLLQSSDGALECDSPGRERSAHPV